MLDMKVGDLEETVLDTILVDAFDWLVQTFGNDSLKQNKPNHIKKRSALKPYVHKSHLHLIWSYKPHDLPWYYEGQFGEYNTRHNSITVHCDKRHTLQFVLDTLFHEYKHSQQSMYLYNYIRVDYSAHPLEIEANTFAAEQIPLFWKKYKKKLSTKK